MTFTVAVASGDRAVSDLAGSTAARRASGEVAWAGQQGRAVAWTTEHPWVGSADDGDVLVVLDGQLHNLYERDLAQAELLRRRYQRLGPTLAEGLLGDFVIVVLDRARDQLIVCRDPLGVRPWYQAASGPRHAGASEVATLCSLPWVDDSVDEAEALLYLAGEMQSRGATIHRGITSLAPGGTWVDAGAAPQVRRHHRWEISPEPEVGWDEAVDRTRRVVDDAVRDRVRVAGAATSELSGGLDSSAVVGTLVALGCPGVLAGRLLFDGPNADERVYSDAVIEHWGLRAVSAGPWLPTDDETDALSAELHRPLPDPNFTMSVGLDRAFLAEGRTSALTGLGGDDAFVAMPMPTLVVSTVQQRQWSSLARLAGVTSRNPRRSWRHIWRPTLAHLRPRRPTRIPGYLSPEAVRRTGIVDRLTARPARLTGVRAVDSRCDGLTSGYVASILEDAAVVSDLTGWRTTHPFLDPRVITATYGLNPWFPHRTGHYRALQAAAFADRVPDRVQARLTKAHFAEVVPARSHDDLRRLAQGPLAARGWIYPAGMEELLGEKGADLDAFLVHRLQAMSRWLQGTC